MGKILHSNSFFSSLLGPLKSIAIGFAQGFTLLVGLPFRMDGYSMFVGAHRYVVVDYCAGLSYVLMGLFLGLTLGLLIYRSWWRISALVLLGGGVAILANGLRIIGIVAYDHFAAERLELEQHIYFELPALAVCFGALFVVFSGLALEPKSAADPVRPVAKGNITLKRVGSVMFAAALIASAPFLWPSPPLNAANSVTDELMPVSPRGWVRDDTGTDWKPKAIMETVKTSLVTYAQADARVSIFVAQSTSRGDKVSGGAVDLAGGKSWMPAFKHQVSICGPTSCRNVLHSKYLMRGSDRVRHIPDCPDGLLNWAPRRFKWN